MSDCLSAQLGDLIADGATEDDDGILWSVTSIDGWYDSTQVRSATQEREPVGEVITVARENARAIVVNLDAFLPAKQALGALAFTAIATAKRAGRCVYVPELLTVTDPLRATQALVRRTGSIKTAIVGELVVVQAQIPLTAPDARRYAPTGADDSLALVGAATSVGKTLTVGGDVSTPGVYVMKGPATNPKLLSHAWGSPQPFIQWIGTLPDTAHNITVDTAAGTVKHNGVDTVLAAGSVLFELVAGDNLLTYSRTSATTGDAECDVSWADAYD